MKNPDQVAAKAEDLFHKGCNCAESVSAALLDAMGEQCSCIPALATGFGGGVGHTGNICGAVTGGIMAVGLASARKGLRDHAAEKRWANDLGAELIDAFARQYNYVECRNLINVDFRRPDWVDQYRSRGCKELCDGFVRFVAAWVADRLAAEGL